MRKVLVTGGAGYVGAHCCKAIAARGFSPVVFDDLSTGHAEFVKWGPLVRGDIRDGAALAAALAEHRPVAVMHFAALALVGQSVADPSPYWDVNVGGALRLLEAMRAHAVAALVFSSTCAVYGAGDGAPLREDADLRPINPYGASKLAAERMMDDFDHAYGLRSVRLRYFNAAGAAAANGLGEDRALETHLIPLVIDAARGRRAHIDVYGVDFPTPDGTAVRDYIHVEDLADAHVLALEHLLAGRGTIALNLGTGRGASVREVIAMVEKISGLAAAAKDAPRRAGDPASLVAAPGRAREALGWSAERSDLATIVTDALAWRVARFG